MKQAGFLLLWIILTSTCLVAQDVIIMKNGDEIKSKVTEIGINEIKYKKFDNLNGPVITVAKSDVFMIKYENGTKDIISSNTNSSKSKDKDHSTDKRYTALIYAGVAIPVGPFASSNLYEMEAGAAKVGGTLGHEGDINISNSNVYFSYGANFTFTPYKLVYIDPYYTFTLKGTYVLFFGMAGFKFKSNPAPARAYGNFMIGACGLGITGDFHEAGLNGGAGLAFAAGTGVEINKHLNIGLRYFNSSPKFTVTSGVLTGEGEQKVGVIQIIFGYQL